MTMQTYMNRYAPPEFVIADWGKPNLGIFAAGVAAILLLRDQMRLWQRRTRERTDLAEMSDYELRDMGMTKADAINECEKPFWRA